MSFDPSRIRSVHLVPLTAFGKDGRLNAEVQAEHTRRMYAAGIRVYMPAAGTGEFHNLSLDEVVEVVRITREASGPDAQIFAPVGFQVQHAIDIGRRAREVGATGIMFMPFVHPYMSDVGAKEYYEAVLDKVQLPALIYKKSAIPSDKLLLSLADHPHVVGVKYAENQMHEFRKVMQADGGRLEWLCGSAERFAPYYMLAGSTGYTTGAGNLCPHLTLAMHAAFTAGEYAEGMRLQQLLQPIEDYRERQGDSYNISMLKQAIKLTGLDFGLPRPPQRQLTAPEAAEVDRIVGPVLEAEAELHREYATIGLR